MALKTDRDLIKALARKLAEMGPKREGLRTAVKTVVAGEPPETGGILTVAEICRGILGKPRGRKRAALEVWFKGADGPQELFAGRVLAFDEKAAIVWAQMMAKGKATGRPRNALDMIIAADASANDCVIVTDNVKDFEGVRVVNPMRGGVTR